MKKDILRVFGTNILKIFVTLITTFVIPKIISVDQYGYLKLYQFYASYVGITHLGFCDGIYLKYGGEKYNTVHHKVINNEITTLFVYEFCISIVLFIFGIINNDFIIISLSIISVPSVLSTMCTYIFQAVGDFVSYSRVINLSTIFSLFINIVLVMFRINNYKLYIIADCCIQIILVICNLFFLNRKVEIQKGIFDFSIFKNMVKFGILLLLGNFAYSLFLGIDRWFINFSLKIEDFSRYSFAGQMVTIVNMFISPISMTLYSHLSARKSKIFEQNVKKMILCFLMIIPMFIFAVKIFVNMWLPEYSSALDVMSILLITQIFLALNTSIYVNLFKVYKRQKAYFIRLLFALFVAIVLDVFVLFINPTIYGFAISTLIACLVWNVLNNMYFKYLKPKSFEVFYVFILIFIYIFLSKISLLLALFLYILFYFFITNLLMKDVCKKIYLEVNQYLQKIKNSL